MFILKLSFAETLIEQETSFFYFQLIIVRSIYKVLCVYLKVTVPVCGKCITDYPLWAKPVTEVANLTERKNPHTPVYGIKEFVCLSVVIFWYWREHWINTSTLIKKFSLYVQRNSFYELFKIWTIFDELVYFRFFAFSDIIKKIRYPSRIKDFDFKNKYSKLVLNPLINQLN